MQREKNQEKHKGRKIKREEQQTEAKYIIKSNTNNWKIKAKGRKVKKAKKAIKKWKKNPSPKALKICR